MIMNLYIAVEEIYAHFVEPRCVVLYAVVRLSKHRQSSIRLENFVPTGLDSHSVNNKVSVFLVVYTQL